MTANDRHDTLEDTIKSNFYISKALHIFPYSQAGFHLVEYVFDISNIKCNIVHMIHSFKCKILNMKNISRNRLESQPTRVYSADPGVSPPPWSRGPRCCGCGGLPGQRDHRPHPPRAPPHRHLRQDLHRRPQQLRAGEEKQCSQERRS